MRETLYMPPQKLGYVCRHRGPSGVGHLHSHDSVEFNLVTRGTAVYIAAGARCPIMPHTIIWFFPHQEHLLLKQSPDFEMYVCTFSPELTRAHAGTDPFRTLLEDDPDGAFCRLLGEDYPRIDRLCRQLLDWDAEPTVQNAGLGYLLVSAWAAFRSGDPLEPAAGEHPAISAAMRRMHADPAADLPALARAVQLSPAHLSRLFRDRLGLTVTEVRNRLRLSHFLRIQEEGAAPTMLAAALRAGFGSYAQFYRVFRDHFEQSPSRYCQKRPSS